jgi:hypothetical protein
MDDTELIYLLVLQLSKIDKNFSGWMLNVQLAENCRAVIRYRDCII